MKSLRFARLGLHSFWEVDFTMCVCYCRLTLLGLLGFCELYFADLILSLLISSWLVCCVRFVVKRLLCFLNNLVWWVRFVGLIRFAGLCFLCQGC